jgi:hypothetical protein
MNYVNGQWRYRDKIAANSVLFLCLKNKIFSSWFKKQRIFFFVVQKPGELLNTCYLCEASGSQGGECEDESVLGYSAVQSRDRSFRSVYWLHHQGSTHL